MSITDEYKLLQLLYDGSQDIVFKAIEIKSSTLVVVKFSREKAWTKLRNKFRKEFEIGNLFSSQYGIKYIDLKEFEGRPALIMEDFGGISLAQILLNEKQIAGLEFLQLAIQLVKGLASIHNAGILHQRINPHHILVNRKILSIKYVDFSFSTLLHKKYQIVLNSNELEENLEWISPEQTGKMNKDVDFRSDYYSLGVVLYQIYCGVLPFTGSEPYKLIYAHMAKSPIPPSQINPQVSPTISNIILKLLAKNPEDRYQSSHGILMDLTKCIEGYSNNNGSTNFDIGEHDINSTFQICQKLYGREEDIKLLVNSFESIISGEVFSNLALVSGYSGIGKSSLINEVHKPLVRQGGRFISGKIDQFARGIPYGSIVQAFKQLVATILAEKEEKILYWKKKLLSALKQKGQVIIEVIPQVSLIIGPQPPVPELGPSETQARFHSVFVDFIGAFTDESHPLVIFLDDLQWADVPTLTLVEHILTNPDLKNLFIIGAYRDNEVDEVHPLIIILNRIKRKKAVLEISLKPLHLNHIINLISDSLRCTKESSLLLGGLVFEKTHGNPFFVNMFLTNLSRERLLFFDHEEGKWKWNIIDIQEKNFTDDVVNMMIQRIRKLDSQTQEVLSLAAAIGNKFDISTLSVIYKQSLKETTRAIWPAVKDELLLVFGEESGLILPSIDDSDHLVCQFLHDRVQQAAYRQIDPQSQRKNHLLIGRLLIQNTPKEKLNENLFDILFHFKMAKEFLNNPEENISLSQLFYLASQRAKDSSAYYPGYEYARFGIDLLPPNMWESHYELTLYLHKQLVECDYLRGCFQSAEDMYPKILEFCKTIDDKVKIIEVKIGQFELQQRYTEVIDSCIECLKFYGVHVPHYSLSTSTLQELLKKENDEINNLTQGRDFSFILKNQKMVDPQQRQVLSLLVSMWAPGYCIGNKIHLALVSTMTAKYTILHGNSDLSALAFIIYSFALPIFSTNYKQAYNYGMLGFDLLELYPNPILQCKAYFINGIGAMNWIMPLRHAFSYIDLTMEHALEVSDIPVACYSAHHMVVHRYLSGVSLLNILQMYRQNFAYLKRMNTFIYHYGYGVSMPVRLHLGIEEDITEDEFVLQNKQNRINLGTYYVGKVQCFFWENSKDFTKIFKYIQLAMEYEEGVMGFYSSIEVQFLRTLLYLSAFSNGYMDSQVMKPKSEMYWKQIRDFVEYLELLATDCPSNNEHKLFLVKAEIERIKGNKLEAIQLFNKARISANQHSFLQYEALANELAGRLWHSLSMQNYAKTHIQEAIVLYGTWGSKLKVSQMCTEFSQYLSDITLVNHISMPESNDSSNIQTSLPQESEFKMISEALSAISSDSSLEKVLHAMMKIVIENSGAQRGLFFLTDSSNELLTVAEGNADNMKIQTMRIIPTTYPLSIVNYVLRTRETIILEDASLDVIFGKDPFIIESRIKSVQCTPIIKNGILKGIIYLENTLLSKAFDNKKKLLVDVIANQMTMHLENAKFKDLLESEKRYRALSAELEAVKKRLEEYIDTLCHELRNPLNGIYGNKEILCEMIPKLKKSLQEMGLDGICSDLEKIDEIIDSISISAEHLKDIVDTVLNISKLEKGEKLQNVLFNPQEIAEKVVSIFKARYMEKNLFIKLSISDLIPIWGDKYRLTQVLINIVSNALKFTPSGGITISLEQEIKEDHQVLLQCKVEDTGIGLSEEEINKLFRPFSQANSNIFAKYGGSGLGLQLCQRMVKLMGGDIQMSSRGANLGTTCKFHVLCKTANTNPIEENSNQQKAISTNFNRAFLPGKTRILITEDNVINQHILRKMLEQQGYSTDLASNGKQALERVISSHGAFQVILMDLEMPVMNGLEATRKIRQFEKENNILNPLWIIGVSANARETYIKTATENGMDGYITKPFQRKDILHSLGISNNLE